jgi:hypothetical protein
LPAKAITNLDIRTRQLTDLLRAYFRHEGRGHECLVDPLDLGDKLIFFAYPEDYRQTTLEWGEDGLKPVQRRPIFDVIFVYEPMVGALDTFYLGTNTASGELQMIFARTMLDTEIQPRQMDRYVYELNQVRNRDFQLDVGSSLTVTDIRIKKFRFGILGKSGETFTVEVDPDRDRCAAHDRMEKIAAAIVGSAQGLALVNIIQVGFKAYFRPDGSRGRNTKSFDIGHPHSCSLGHEGRDVILREILLKSALETTIAPKDDH